MKITNKETEKQDTTLKEILSLKSESKAYRDTFATDWLEIEEQINCIPPTAWKKKQDWQTKIFIPLQAKASETAVSYLSKMLFAVRRFFNISGVEKRDKEAEGNLMTLYDSLLEKGHFWLYNNYVLQEACDLGTSFLKVLPNKDGTGLIFSWRSVRHSYPDPKAIVDFYKSRFWAEEYTEDLADIMQNPLYDKEAKDKLLLHLANKTSQTRAKQEDLISIANAEGNAQMQILKDFCNVTMTEYWGKVKTEKEKEVNGVKVKYYELEDRVVTVADDTITMRKDKNEIGCIPVVICRVKRKKYHIFGNGFLSNCRGLQELMNSLINLGFDSLKISSMDIIRLDENAVADASSIEYRPLAVWKFREGRASDGAIISRQPISAIGEVLKGITLIDQIHQDASGVTRHAQGTPMIAGKEETLGEYQLKLQAIEQRFLKIAREIEEDYIIPLLKLIFKIITNPKIFSQDTANRILGMNEIKEQITSPLTGQPEEIVLQQPKIILSELGKMDFDFKATGLTQFIQKTEILQKLKEVMAGVIKTPQLQMLVKVDKLFERLLQMADIPDYEDFLRNEEEKKQLLNQIMQQVPIEGGV